MMNEYPTPNPESAEYQEFMAKKRALALHLEMQEGVLEQIKQQIADNDKRIAQLERAQKIAEYLTIRTLPLDEQLAYYTETDLFNPFDGEIKENWELLLQLALTENRIPDLLNWIRDVLKIEPVFTMYMPASIIMKRIDQMFDLSSIEPDVQTKPTEEFWSYIANNISSGKFPKK